MSDNTELPAWMERPIGRERPAPEPVPYASRPSYERVEMLRAEARRVVDEALRTAPASARDNGRTAAARVALGAVDEAMERLAYVLVHLHDAATIEELDETQRGPTP